MFDRMNRIDYSKNTLKFPLDHSLQRIIEWNGFLMDRLSTDFRLPYHPVNSHIRCSADRNDDQRSCSI